MFFDTLKLTQLGCEFFFADYEALGRRGPLDQRILLSCLNLPLVLLLHPQLAPIGAEMGGSEPPHLHVQFPRVFRQFAAQGA
jgi:hypothetical protein